MTVIKQSLMIIADRIFSASLDGEEEEEEEETIMKEKIDSCL